MLVSPTGSGKTEIAIAMLEATMQKGNKAAMLLDRIVLCDQTSKRLEKYSIAHGVLQSGHWRYRPYEHIQVCSAQTLERRGNFPGLNLLIVDECFTGDTLIDTPTGQKPINLLRCGDTVYNSIGVGKVVRVMARPSYELYKLGFEDGTHITCTGNHPIFTDRGWIKASEMEIGRISFSKKGLRLLWERIFSQESNREWPDSDAYFSGKMGEAYRLLNILLEEAGKSDEQPSGSFENAGEIARDKTQANQARWKWKIASIAATCFASCFGGGLGVGISSGYQDEKLEDWISHTLQNRYCKLSEDDSDRIRRWIALFFGEESTRLEENRISCFPRVVSVSRIERDSIETVFNLHISGHPSYFANGKLVHNCHSSRKQTLEFIKNNPDVRVVGLTATPFTKGLGKTYTNVVNATTTKELVDQGKLVPLRVFIAKEIDMTGAKKVAGEWSQSEASERGMKVTGDVVAEWIKKTHEIFGEPKKTIVFSAGVDHGADLARKFQEQGYNFVSLSYRDDDEWKKQIIEDFAKPDSDIIGLVATDILTKGFDNEEVMIGVSARPFSKSFSSHVQQMGRVMRANQTNPESKPFSLWLDHAGNYLRFREDWEKVYGDGVSELDDGMEKAKPEPTEREKKECKCPRCSALWPANSDTCFNCGHVRERQNKVVAVAGEMEELKGAMSRESKQEFWNQMVYLMRKEGWSSGRAANTYKDRFGVWPRGLSDVVAQPPSAETKKFINKRLYAFMKKIGKK
jgi:superfamily II DNA or RNA helicase